MATEEAVISWWQPGSRYVRVRVNLGLQLGGGRAILRMVLASPRLQAVKRCCARCPAAVSEGLQLIFVGYYALEYILNTGKTKVMFSCSMKDKVEERKVSGPVVYVRRELAIIQFCAMVARNGFINDVVE